MTTKTLLLLLIEHGPTWIHRKYIIIFLLLLLLLLLIDVGKLLLFSHTEAQKKCCASDDHDDAAADAEKKYFATLFHISFISHLTHMIIRPTNIINMLVAHQQSAIYSASSGLMNIIKLAETHSINNNNKTCTGYGDTEQYQTYHNVVNVIKVRLWST